MTTSSFSPPDLETLRSQLNGHLCLPGDARYDELRTPWLQVVDQHPALIVEAASTGDIASAIRFARGHELPLAVMATGHGIAAPCDGGLLLHLGAMKSVTFGPDQTVRVGPGVDAGELLQQTEQRGLIYASGQVSSVGVIGYVLGGGTGWLVRRLGIACDAVLSAEMVLADGSITEVNERENPDLLWAVRGGGGNFGVVSALEMRLAPLAHVVGGEVWYPLEVAPRLLRFYRDWSSGLPDDASSIFRFTPAPDEPGVPEAIRGKPACMIGLCHADPATADAAVQPLLAFEPLAFSTIEARPFSSMATLDPASHEKGSVTYSQTESLRELSDEVIETLCRIARDSHPSVLLTEIQQLGGALRAGDPDRFAFEPPRAPYQLHLLTPLVGGRAEAEVALATQGVLDALGDAFTGEASYNYLRDDEQDRLPAVYGPQKWERLRAIKARVDPHNVFRFNYNIPPES